ncbi:MAG: acyl-CoA dehydrogenase family protein, partial [Candidatus Omnitrophica bacterium]|nr:acyl-CoA dehydrogenase family protein [Candidatus Omnitrophota bacterium]
MDFSIPKETQDILDKVRNFINEEAIPLEHDFLNKGFGEILDVLQEKRKRVKELGLWLPQIEKEWGGMGLSLVQHGLVSAELGRCPLGHYLCNCQAPDAGNMEILIQFGTPDQQDKFLRPLLAGETRSCFSMTEPEFPGSNPVWMNTTAVKDGNDYVINGHKWFTSAADGAAFAVVMAVTDPDGPTHARASQILVPMDTPGVELVCNTSIMGHRGEDWHSHAEMRYTDVRVPKENLLGEEGAGFAIAQER